MKTCLLISCAMLALFCQGTSASTPQTTPVFPRGEANDNPNFVGQTWRQPLVPAENDMGCSVSQITFAPGARNHWHRHPHGQILLVTEGRGYYQERGQPVRELKPGDVVVIAQGVEHWHGAVADQSFTHLTISKGQTTWLEPVSEEAYRRLPQDNTEKRR